MTLRLDALPAGTPLLASATPPPDLVAAGYRESEFQVAGTARSYRCAEYSADGHWDAVLDATAGFATRLLLRRPRDPARFSGTVVVEWLNVSSGHDAAPEFCYLGAEILRRGHAWIGLSAQYAGVEGGGGTLRVPGEEAAPGGLRAEQPDRYVRLRHPGDAYSFGILTEVARALRETDPTTPWSDLVIDRVIAVGASQSAFALTTYYNAVQPIETVLDGFLVHSRGGAAFSLGEPGRPLDLDAERHGPAVRLRADLDAPVLVLQTETDLLSPRLAALAARQPDTARIRTWEVAGSAHADLWQIGGFEEFLGTAVPVNRGQQGYVARAALRHLVAWCARGATPPVADRLQVESEPSRFRLDAAGNVLGGVRTPVVDAPVQRLSGLAAPGGSVLAQLFGSTLPLDPVILHERYAGRADYLEQYAAATDRAIEAGFVLAEDREDVLAEARPDLLEA